MLTPTLPTVPAMPDPERASDYVSACHAATERRDRSDRQLDDEWACEPTCEIPRLTMAEEVSQ